MMNETSTKLLIVDDLPENLRALNALIRESDRSVYQASSGEEALALLDDALANADVLVMLVDHQEFKAISGDSVTQDYIVDTKGVWR